MNKDVDFYMEPVRFFNSPFFLSGSNPISIENEVVTKKDEALRLLFSQDLPSGYLVWSDFISELISDLILDCNYKGAQEKITKTIRHETLDLQKDSIKKRKEFLLKKKAGLQNTNAYDDFVNEVGDEYNYVLMMVSTQRYLKGKKVNNKLEELFDILKAGVAPCGVKIKNHDIVIYNPSELKLV